MRKLLRTQQLHKSLELFYEAAHIQVLAELNLLIRFQLEDNQAMAATERVPWCRDAA